jgi:hypothetical protein
MAAVTIVVAAAPVGDRPRPPAACTTASGVRLYSRDPAHLWNRLHAALFARVAADGCAYGTDRVDPLLWIGSTYLVSGPSHVNAVRILQEFVATHGERLIVTPLERAALQRDLWMVFDWLEGSHTLYGRPPLSPEIVRRAADALRAPLATAIARLALTPVQVRALPDNGAAAARAGALPPDLFAPGGQWVSVGRPDGPVAAQHVRDAGPGRNSVFLVLIRLPGGRAATLQYLERLRSFDGPWWIGSGYPNPGIPQFPAGTRVALVRRALLVDSAGRVTPTALTEQVQLRVYHDIRPMTAQEFEDAHRIDEDMFARAGQEFEELSLSRAALFAGRAGGLQPLSAIDRFFLTFAAQGVDPFEMPGSGRSVPGTPRRAAGMEEAHARRVCKDCHAAPGVFSFNSYLPFRLSTPPGSHVAARLSEISIAEAERVAVGWKEQQANWRSLQALLRR